VPVGQEPVFYTFRLEGGPEPVFYTFRLKGAERADEGGDEGRVRPSHHGKDEAGIAPRPALRKRTEAGVLHF